jgi:hypothetical protein
MKVEKKIWRKNFTSEKAGDLCYPSTKVVVRGQHYANECVIKSINHPLPILRQLREISGVVTIYIVCMGMSGWVSGRN